ncbi:hypothetical protein RintRC_0357 [Richelia intracellularis]|nr:hypothetical protein RintRC_0357 [Richelia intracellularis]
MESHDVEVVDLDLDECKQMMSEFRRCGIILKDFPTLTVLSHISHFNLKYK